MRLEVLADAGLSLLFCVAALVYLARLNRQMGKPALDWSLVALAGATLAVILIILFSR